MPPEGPTLGDLGATESVADSIRVSMTEPGGADGAVLEGGGNGAVPLEPEAPPGSVPVEGGAIKIQNRDEAGRFAEGFIEAQRRAEAAATTPPAAAATTPPAAATPPAENELEPIEPPTSWKLEDQQIFRGLDPAHQRFLMSQLEAATAQRQAHPLDQLVQPRIDGWRRLGQTPETALGQLLAISDFAAQRPRDFIQWFAREHGVDLGQPAATPDAGNLPQGIDPNDPALQDPIVQMVLQQNQQLQGRLEKFENTWRQQIQAQHDQERQRTRQELDNFRDARDERGQLKHPYYEEVRGLMASILDPRSGQEVTDLNVAYEMACRAHPEVHRKIAAATEAAAERARRTEERKKAADAKTAAASVSGTTGSATPAAPTGDLRADLRAEFQARGVYGPPTI